MEGGRGGDGEGGGDGVTWNTVLGKEGTAINYRLVCFSACISCHFLCSSIHKTVVILSIIAYLN